MDLWEFTWEVDSKLKIHAESQPLVSWNPWGSVESKHVQAKHRVFL